MDVQKRMLHALIRSLDSRVKRLVSVSLPIESSLRKDFGTEPTTELYERFHCDPDAIVTVRADLLFDLLTTVDKIKQEVIEEEVLCSGSDE